MTDGMDASNMIPPPKPRKTDSLIISRGNSGNRFWKFKVLGIGNVGPVFCETYAEAISLLRRTWPSKWAIVPNGR